MIATIVVVIVVALVVVIGAAVGDNVIGYNMSARCNYIINILLLMLAMVLHVIFVVVID